MAEEEKKEMRIGKLKAMGITLLPTDSPGPNNGNLFGIENTKEVATVVCGVVNAAVNKTGLMGYLSVVPDIPAAVSDVDLVDNEFLNMDYNEYAQLVEHIKTELDFVGEANAIEEIAENIAAHVIGITHNIFLATQLKNSENN